MSIVIREKPNFLPLINGVAFEVYKDYSVSADISDPEVLAQFLELDGYRLADDGEDLPDHLVAKKAAPDTKQETAKERKVRLLKEEQEAAEAAKAQAEIDAKAEAEAKAAEEAAKAQNVADAADQDGATEDSVF